MHNDAGLDNELAAFTNSILAGEEVQTSPEIADLAQVVRQLKELIPPDSHPDAAFRERLTQRLDREWTLQHQRQPRQWWMSRRVQLSALAATIATVLFALVLLSTNTGDQSVQGTALGSLTETALIAGGVIGIGVLIFWYTRRRNL